MKTAPARRRKGLRFEALAVHYSDGLQAGAGGKPPKLGAPLGVRRGLLHRVADVQLDGEVRDVVREVASDQPHRNGPRRQVIDGTRDARHLLGIGHLRMNHCGITEGAESETTEDTEEVAAGHHHQELTTSHGLGGSVGREAGAARFAEAGVGIVQRGARGALQPLSGR